MSLHGLVITKLIWKYVLQTNTRHTFSPSVSFTAGFLFVQCAIVESKVKINVFASPGTELFVSMCKMSSPLYICSTACYKGFCAQPTRWLVSWTGANTWPWCQPKTQSGWGQAPQKQQRGQQCLCRWWHAANRQPDAWSGAPTSVPTSSSVQGSVRL